MAAVAAITQQVRIGVMVSGVMLRHPALVAKMAITLDHVSGGRAIAAFVPAGSPTTAVESEALRDIPQRAGKGFLGGSTVGPTDEPEGRRGMPRPDRCSSAPVRQHR